MTEGRGNDALKRWKGAGAAPSVGGVVATKIIDLARKNGVPVHEDRNLIELLSTIDLYEEVPMDLFKAVAEVIVYVNRTSSRP